MDIGLLEKVLGKCSSISMFGCYWYDMKKADWNILETPDGKTQIVSDMHESGKKAVKELGKNPSHTTAKFKSFVQRHLSQHV